MDSFQPKQTAVVIAFTKMGPYSCIPQVALFRIKS